MSEILWFIDEANKKITYKNIAKSFLKKLPIKNNSYSKHAIKSREDRHIGYAYVYKSKNAKSKEEQFAYLKELILKTTDETNIKEFSLLGADTHVAFYVMNYFKNQYISGAELMSEIFLMNLNDTFHDSKIGLVIDNYASLLKYYKLFELFKEACILCENSKAIEKYTNDIYLNTATSVYVTSNPSIIKECDIIFFSSLNKKYTKFLCSNNIVLDLNNVIEGFESIKLVKPPKFIDFYENRFSGFFINDMTINTSCAQSLLYALDTDLRSYDKELKLI